MGSEEGMEAFLRRTDNPEQAATASPVITDMRIVNNPFLIVSPIDPIGEEMPPQEELEKLYRAALRVLGPVFRHNLRLTDNQTLLEGSYIICSGEKRAFVMHAHQVLEQSTRFGLRGIIPTPYNGKVQFGKEEMNVSQLFRVACCAQLFDWHEYYTSEQQIQSNRHWNCPEVIGPRDDYLTPDLERQAAEHQPKAIGTGRLLLQQVSRTQGIIAMAVGYFR